MSEHVTRAGGKRPTRAAVTALFAAIAIAGAQQVAAQDTEPVSSGEHVHEDGSVHSHEHGGGSDHTHGESDATGVLAKEHTPSAEERQERAARFRALYGFETPANIDELNSETVWRENPTTSRFGVSLTDAEAEEILYRNELLGLGESTWTDAQSRFAETLGTAYLDHQRGGVLVLTATDGVTRSQLESMFSAVIPDGRLLVEPASVSGVRLRETVDLISAEIGRGSLSDRGVNGLSGDDIAGEVIISVDAGSDRGLIADLASQAAGSSEVPIRVVQQDLSGSDSSAVRGGSLFSGGATCTAGFAIRDQAGTEFNLTAGHCPNAKKHGHGPTMGIMAAHSDWALTSSVDHYDYQIQRTFLHDGNDGTVLVNPHTGNTTGITTNLVTPWSLYDQQGSTLCYYGQARGVLCGPITRVSFGATFTHGGTPYWNDWLREVSSFVDASGGDSGGPVYAPNSSGDRPAGILKGHINTNSYGDFVYHLVHDALNRANSLAFLTTVYYPDPT